LIFTAPVEVRRSLVALFRDEFGGGGKANFAQEGVGSDGGFDFWLIGGEFPGGPHSKLRIRIRRGREFGRGARSDPRGARPTHFFAEVLGAFGEGEAFVGDVLAVSVHVLLMSVHLLVAMVFAEFDLAFVFAVVGEGGEIGEALEGEEPVRGVIARPHKVKRGVENSVEQFVGDVGLFAGSDRVEVREGDSFAGGDLLVDLVDGVLFGVKVFEGLPGDNEAEAIRPRQSDAFENLVVGLMWEPTGDLVDFLFGKTGKGALFSHKTEGEKGEIKDLRRKNVDF
jgi:hypothetical protein